MTATKHRQYWLIDWIAGGHNRAKILNEQEDAIVEKTHKPGAKVILVDHSIQLFDDKGVLG